jgi:signal transduction histidine kinase
MRKRLIVAFVTLVVTIILLYGLPRVFVLSDLVRENGDELVVRGADISAVLVADALEDGRRVTPGLLEPVLRPGERVEYRGANGQVVVVPADTTRGEDDLVARRSLDDGSSVTYSSSGADLTAEIRSAVLPLVLLGLGLIPLGVLAGALLARRLARPFSELAQTARAMGAGELRVEPQRYDVPEADEIASALHESGRRLEFMLQRERDVAVNASHELRTPITALRLALEDVAQWPETPRPVADELARLVSEVDRLSTAVTGLLAAAEDSAGSDVEVDLVEVMHDVADRWRTRLTSGALVIEVRTPGSMRARLPRATVGEVLEGMLAMAVSSAPGPVVVRGEDRGSHLRVTCDVPGALAEHDGARRRQVSDAAVSMGGRLTAETREGHTHLELVLPQSR